MGLLSRLTSAVTPQKKASDDVLLVHCMMLMSCADGTFEASEVETMQAFFMTLPEFEGKNFGNLLAEAKKTILGRYSNLTESVKALADLSTPNLKKKAFIIAADIAMSSGDVDENEDKLLDAMQRVLNVDDATATKVLEVLSMKYAK